jgi:hypothetical protein
METEPAASASRPCTVYFVLAILTLVFFWPLVLHPRHLLYSDHSDFLALDLPAAQFQLNSYRQTGELPLWCPYCFAGRPFSFTPYPFHWFFFLVPAEYLPESALGMVLSWLLVLQVFLAGVGMFSYARWRGLGQFGALVAACGTMFAGRWLLHMLGGGHYFVGLCWLPFVLLWYERAVRRGSLVAATLAAIFYGLLAWGLHPQLAFYGGLFLALWVLGAALEEAGFLGDADMPRSPGRTARCLARWLGYGLWTAGLGMALAAAQLMPLIAFTEGATRHGGVSTADLLQLGRLTFFNLVGPSVQLVPVQGTEWEDRGGLGVVILFLAVAAPFLRPTRRIGYQTAVCALLFLFGLGGVLLLQELPGFNVFRQPARMFAIAGIPVAYLAGVSVDALLAEPAPDSEKRGMVRFVLVVLLILIGALVFSWTQQLANSGYESVARPYWYSLIVTVPVLFWLLGDRGAARPVLGIVWLLIVLIDLWSLTWPYLHTRRAASVYPMSASVRYLADHRSNHGRVLDEDVDPEGRDLCSPLGRGAPMALRLGIEPLRGYSPIDLARYKKFLQFVADEDKPLEPLRDPLTFPVLRDLEIKNWKLIDLLGTRYLLRPADQPPPPGWHEVLDDPEPHAFDLITGGVHALDAYALYENPNAFPRAWVASSVQPISDADALEQLKSADLRETVLLEGQPADAGSDSAAGTTQRVGVIEYKPNEVRVQVHAGEPGYLVLADPWYKGWTATVNGVPAEVLRADYLFRATPVPAEECEVVFRFEPSAPRDGACISAAAAGLAGLILLIGWLRRPRSPLVEGGS